MTNLTMADLASRSVPMADDKPKRKKRWVKQAINPEHKGQLRRKAEAAGESTREFAEAHKHDSGTTGAQSRLAITLMGMSHHKRARAIMYDHKRSKRSD